MKKLLFLVTFLSIALGYGQISITGTGAANTYSQDFDTLASTGTSSSVPAGWAFSEAGSNANSTINLAFMQIKDKIISIVIKTSAFSTISL